jgi:hypothetical protein
MPKWVDLIEDDLWQQIATLDSTCSYADDPLSDWERAFGLRFFRKGSINGSRRMSPVAPQGAGHYWTRRLPTCGARCERVSDEGRGSLRAPADPPPHRYPSPYST